VPDDPWSAFPGDFIPSHDTAVSWLAGLGSNRKAPADVLIRLLDVGRPWFLYRRDLPPEVIDAAVVHPSKRVWMMAAEELALSPQQWDRLLAATAGVPRMHELALELAEEAQERSAWPRRGIERPPHPGARPPATLTEIAELAAAVPDIAPNLHVRALWWIGALHDNADAMRQLASSPKIWVRRSVAHAQHLPPDVLDLLARDEDRVVRLFLAESCDDAPAEVLLDVWTWWSGSLSVPDRPRGHPNFPRTGLLRFATDPHPRLRMLALDDPESSPAVAEALARDPDGQVRARAARDPRLPAAIADTLSHDPDDHVRRAAACNPLLPPASIIRLTADPDHWVHEAARRHPDLPADFLISLLLGPKPDTAEDAAKNPAIPVPVMHAMITLAKPRAFDQVRNC
jgi:hypothetical protein